jgi:hypothetical protein
MRCSIGGNEMAKIQIRFDGPPSHESGRFIEVENEAGESIDFGAWKPDGDDWLLIFEEEVHNDFANGLAVGSLLTTMITLVTIALLAELVKAIG